MLLDFKGGGGVGGGPISDSDLLFLTSKCQTISRGGAKTILFGGCKTTFCRQKGVASALLGRGQNEPYSFLSDVQR